MSDQSQSFVSSSPEQTSHIAQRLAGRLQEGDTLLLSGSIGAGKTHFARSLIQTLLPQPEDVPSPTFTLVQVYDTDKAEIWHVDLYRIGGEDGCVELGLIDAFDTAICLVEWPDRLGHLKPPGALAISFELGALEDDRLLTFCWSDPKWTNRMSQVTA